MSRLIRSTLKLATLGLALGLMFNAGARAQSNASGNLAGHAQVGDKITVQNPETGFTRTVTVGKSGRFRVSSLPLGTYIVTLKHADGTVYKTQPAAVRLGSTTSLD